MKICIVRHGEFPDDPRVRKEVFALLDAKHDVDVICLKRKGQSRCENIKGARVFRIPVVHKRGSVFRYLYEYSLSFILFSAYICVLFIRRRYSCVQVNTMPDFLVFATIIPKWLGARVLIDLHEPTPELWITKFGGNNLKLVFKLLAKMEQLAIKYADRALTVTSNLRQRYGERGADIGKITVIPNVCDEVFLNNEKVKSGVTKREFTLITHGLIDERYGHEVVIRAVKEIGEKIPSLRFNILGYGEQKYIRRLSRLTRDLNCSDQIRLLGYLPFNEYLEKMYEADIGVIPMLRSPYSELIDTNKMYEYIALRKPVVISRLPPVEGNFDDSCLMFFEPGDEGELARCIIELYNDPEKRRELVENSFERYQKMKWSKAKDNYLDILKKLDS